MNLNYQKLTLKFTFNAGTSRGVYRVKDTWIITVQAKGIKGYGECGPLPGLSVDVIDKIPLILKDIAIKCEKEDVPASTKQAYQLAHKLAPGEFPSIRFGLETAFLDVLSKGRRILFNSDFALQEKPILINGLIWMGDFENMKQRALEKIKQGYRCIKVKIGAIGLEEELELIRLIRSHSKDLIIRLDANGAFKPDEALAILEKFASFKIHSVEQPITAGEHDRMKELCRISPIPVALDEELIGVNALEEKVSLLKHIQPQYIILKPTLLGGFASCDEWIKISDQLNVGWWLTSALESNIGLNAIAQYTAYLNAKSFQGLGTGQLYENNIESPLRIEGDNIFYKKDHNWDYSLLEV